MSSTRRRWVWLAIVALLALVWWLVPRPTSPSPTAEPATSERREPTPKPGSIPVEHEETKEREPVAVPLPRHEVELSEAAAPADGGVDDPVPVERRRDEMLSTVLARLNAELEAAEEAGNEEEAARLRIRVERLSQRRDELAEP